MPTVESNGASLHFESHGDGAPVLFVHGAGGNTLVWWRQAFHFSASRRVLLTDLRGFGRSRCTAAHLQPRYFASDVGRVLDAAGVERASLVCQSMGGFAGLPFAIAHPERVSALVLCGTPGGLYTERVLHDVLGLQAKREKLDALALTFSPGFRRRAPEAVFLYSQMSALTPPGVLEMAIARIAEVRVRPEQLVGWRVPTLVLGGDEDAFFAPETLAEVASQIPGARHEVLEGVGHASYFEAPEAFDRLVDDFLTKNGV